MIVFGYAKDIAPINSTDSVLIASHYILKGGGLQQHQAPHEITTQPCEESLPSNPLESLFFKFSGENEQTTDFFFHPSAFDITLYCLWSGCFIITKRELSGTIREPLLFFSVCFHYVHSLKWFRQRCLHSWFSLSWTLEYTELVVYKLEVSEFFALKRMQHQAAMNKSFCVCTLGGRWTCQNTPSIFCTSGATSFFLEET